MILNINRSNQKIKYPYQQEVAGVTLYSSRPYDTDVCKRYSVDVTNEQLVLQHTESVAESCASAGPQKIVF